MRANAGQAVVSLVGSVAKDEAVLVKLVRDREDSTTDPLVCGRKEAHQGH